MGRYAPLLAAAVNGVEYGVHVYRPRFTLIPAVGGPFNPAMIAFAKQMAIQNADCGVRVNAILPGWIDTELTRNARQQVPTLNANVLARSPSGRWGSIDDFEGIAAFLAGPGADFITGAAIPVDGGFSSQG